MTAIEQLIVHRFLVKSGAKEDPRANSILLDAHTMGVPLSHVECADLYFIAGDLSETDAAGIEMLLHDPLAQHIEHSQANVAGQADVDASSFSGWVVEVALRAGVTDPVAEQILRAGSLLGIRGMQAAASGQRFILQGDRLAEADVRTLAQKLLSNPVIQRYAIGEVTDVFPPVRGSEGVVEHLPVRGCDDTQLLALSQERRAALDLQEMRAVRDYCRQEGRDLTDVEFEMIAQTWSEHCVHKTFKAHIDVTRAGQAYKIGNLFRETIQAATRRVGAGWVRSAFVDNAGVIAFDEEYDLAFKVETHNHPSAIEPFGGANTGVGGVIRDVIGVSARPVACTDVLCFGPQDMPFGELPEGVLHPRRIFSGVVAGVQDYGNKIGIPTVSGAIWYDPGYTANPLVYCGCLGLVPRGAHPRNPQAGDRVIVLGGRTGRDGLRGATFSSMAMDAQTGEVAGASVQIGAPVVEKGLIDVIMLARDARLYHAITDCGAGGLSSAVGEMAGGTGVEVELERVPLKYAGLAPWEIWLSEAQERMVLAVPEENLEALAGLCRRYDVEMTNIGRFTANGRVVVQFAGRTVVNLDNAFLHGGLPQRHLAAVVKDPLYPAGTAGPLKPPGVGYAEVLLRLLAHPNIASKSAVIRVYDHEVQGGSVVRPLTGSSGEGPADAVVIKPQATTSIKSLALSAGFNPEYGKPDPYQMAINVIDEAVRNALAAGADPQRIAILDNFCWGDPRRPETLGELTEAARGCHDAAVYFGAPFISGKDSLNNEYLGADGARHAIPPSLLISGLGILEDWRQAVTTDLKRPGSLLYLVGELQPVFGGSHYNLVMEEDKRQLSDGIPSLHHVTRTHYSHLHQAIQQRLVRACHDLSEGGLAVAAAEMCIGGGLGLELEAGEGDLLRWLFGETTGCLLVEVDADHSEAFERLFGGRGAARVGRVVSDRMLTVRRGGETPLALSVVDLARAWNAPAQAVEAIA